MASACMAVHPRASGGAVLLLAMVFMLLLGLLAASTLHSGALESHMAGNNQFQEDAFQRAQAVATEISQSPGNFPLVGGVGYRICEPGDDDAACNNDGHYLGELVSAAVPEGLGVSYHVTRQGPLFLENFPVREPQDEASGSGHAVAAIFEISVHVDGSGAGLGSARVVQGIAVRVAAAH